MAFSNEILVILDRRDWVWSFIKTELKARAAPFVRIPSKVSLQNNWFRFSKSPFFVVH